MKKFLPLSKNELGYPILVLTLLLGIWVRLSAPYLAGFPINDGGLFQVMIITLQKHAFILPKFIEFSGSTLPFTYPPLGFYTGAFLSQQFRIDPIQILQWLPAIVLIFTIPAFFWLASPILESPFTAGLATFIYAFTPIATQWAIMGGGLTRSFGLLFLILTIGSTYRLYNESSKKHIFSTIIFGSLTILSHPDASLNTAAFCLILWVFYGRSQAGFFKSIAVLMGILTLTAIWWIPILLRFGPAPYLIAAQSNPHLLIGVIFPFLFLSTAEPQITFIAVLGLIGFAYSLSQKKYLLPLLFLMPYLVHLRSASVFAVISLAMLAALTFENIVLPLFLKAPLQNNFIYSVSLIFLTIYLPGNAMLSNYRLVGTTVSIANRQAFEWVKLNTSKDSRFLILTGETNGYCDGISEWFPALSNRINPVVVQGNEWLPGKLYSTQETYTKLQSCLSENNAIECIESVTKEKAIEYNYLYISRQAAIKESCWVISTATKGDGLIKTLEINTKYSIAYKSDQVAIFMLKSELP